jgi:hypothetical protein
VVGSITDRSAGFAPEHFYGIDVDARRRQSFCETPLPAQVLCDSGHHVRIPSPLSDLLRTIPTLISCLPFRYGLVKHFQACF